MMLSSPSMGLGEPGMVPIGLLSVGGSDSFTSVTINGTGGAGFLALRFQASQPTGTAGYTTLYTDNAGVLNLVTGTSLGGSLASANSVTAAASTDLSLIAGPGANNNVAIMAVGTGSILANTAALANRPTLTGDIYLNGTGGSGVRGGIEFQTSTIGAGYGVRFSGNTNSSGDLALQGRANNATWSNFWFWRVSDGAFITPTLLVNTPTNNSNGAIQLASSINSTAGIAWGSDVSLYRAGNGLLDFNDTGGNPKLQLLQNGTAKSVLQASSGNTYLDSAGSTFLRTGSLVSPTLALTLDSSQNATFAGSITDVGTTNGAAAWKHGPIRTGTGLVFDTTRGIQVNVAGTTITLAVLTTNP